MHRRTFAAQLLGAAALGGMRRVGGPAFLSAASVLGSACSDGRFDKINQANGKDYLSGLLLGKDFLDDTAYHPVAAARWARPPTTSAACAATTGATSPTAP